MERQKQEFIKFEVTLYFEPELKDSIDNLKKIVDALLLRIPAVQDVDIETIKTGRI